MRVIPELTFTYVCIYVYAPLNMHVYLPTYTDTYTYIYAHTHTQTQTCIYICVQIYIYIFVYKPTIWFGLISSSKLMHTCPGGPILWVMTLEDKCLSVCILFYTKLQGHRDPPWYCRQLVDSFSLPLKTAGT